MDQDTLLSRAATGIDKILERRDLRSQSVCVVRAEQEENESSVERVLSDQAVREIGLVEPLHQEVQNDEEDTSVKELAGSSRAVTVDGVKLGIRDIGEASVRQVLNSLIGLRERDGHEDHGGQGRVSKLLIVDERSEPISHICELY